MAIWDKLLKAVISPVIKDTLREETKKVQDNNLEKGLLTQAPSWSAITPLSTTGKNSVVNKLFPRGVSFQALRDFSLYYPILRSCINYRKRQITQLDWDISPIDVTEIVSEDKQHKKDIKFLKEFLRYPLGDKTISFRMFVSKIIEDLTTLDAVAIYKRMNRGGGTYGFIPIDAATIDLILNKDGTTPPPPEPAYIQKINGMETARLSTDELIYRIMNPRTNSPYGLSPVETLVLTVTTALKLTSFNLAYLTEGNVPEGFVELPKDIASNPDQLKLWQDAWDTMFSGDPRYQRKIKFLPEGMKWNPIRKSEDMEFERFDKWLLLQTCSVLEVPPQAIGFQFDRGKGATEAEWEIGKERGLFPLANFLKEIMDQIVQDHFGFKDLQFVWTNINPTNKVEEVKVFDSLVRTGAVSVDEWRVGEGLEPINCPHYIMTPIGPIFVKDLVEQSDSGQQPTLPYAPATGATPKPQGGGAFPSIKPKPKKYAENNSGNVDGKPTKDPKKAPTKDTQEATKKINETINEYKRGEVVEELKRWKKAALNDLKSGKMFRDFKTDVVDYRTQGLIKNGLKVIKSKIELDQLFDPLISQENQVIQAMLDLYDEIDTITNSYGTNTIQENPIST